MEDNKDIVDDLVAELEQMAQLESGKKSDINLVGLYPIRNSKQKI